MVENGEVGVELVSSADPCWTSVAFICTQTDTTARRGRCVCVYVCVREREREGEKEGGDQ